VPTPAENLVEALTEHRRWLLRYEAETVRGAVAAYTKATAPVLARLQALARAAKGQPLTSAQEREVAALRTSLERAIRAARAPLQDGLQTRLLGAIEAEAERVPALLSEALPPGVEAKSVPLSDLAELLRTPFGGQTYAQRLDVSLLQVRDRIDAGLAAALEQGAGMDKAARLLEAAVGDLEGGRPRLVRIARTEIQRVANATAQRTYAANRDVLAGVRYLATLDDRACAVCEPLHNEEFPLDPETGEHKGPDLPRHPACRCFYAPISKSWEELGMAGNREAG
jgi:SPP1 gp7 family putative phage head morphogenesis protein